jgi:GNAT superfamily N-acetyltransferase
VDVTTSHKETAVLRGDYLVTIRPITAADAGALMEFYAALSVDARRQRFFHVHRVRADEAARMAGIEQRGDGVALVAVDDDNSIVADARCVRGVDPADRKVADLAVVVRDDYQGLGLGHLLMDRLITAASGVRITTIVAELFSSNVAMRRLLSNHHFAITERDGLSLVEARLSTDGRIPTWPAGTTRPRVLIEGGSWYGSLQERNLRDAGFSVAVCPGPPHGESCDLLATGGCRLAEGADAIICSTANEESCQVLAAHQAARAVRPLFVTGGPEQLPPTGRARPISSTGTAGELLHALRAEGIQPPA